MTGLTVNTRINVDKRFYKQTRAMLNNLITKGEFEINGKKGNLNQLEGRIAFINQIENYNNKINDELTNKVKDKENEFILKGKKGEYKKFLLYKYLYNPSRPMIITEGKTDIIHIKAALKKVYYKYPKLITMKDGKFKFNLCFYEKKRKLLFERLFNVEKHGGTKLVRFLKFYNSDKMNTKYLKNNIKYRILNPIILLCDNEPQEGNSPLNSIANYIKKNFKNYECIENIKKKEYIKVHRNLYVTKIVNCEKSENENIKLEIEDLYEDVVLKTKIKGKSFERGIDKNENEGTYSKKIFAEYIYSNYNKINFDGFLPLLDNINSIIEEYEEK